MGHDGSGRSNEGRRHSRRQGDVGKVDGVEGLVRDVAEEAFDLGGECVRTVRVVVRLPKLVLLADSFTVDITLSSDYTPESRERLSSAQESVTGRTREGKRKVVKKEVRVEGIVVPVVIGVNPPERLAKQRVVTDLVFYEREDCGLGHVGYRKVVDSLVKDIEASSYLSLEKFVHELARKTFQEEERIEAVRVRARKPSALGFADFSGVEVTRRRGDYGL
ncbi:hypothetical protein NMY22_g6863 [Coprinellus aureogranulatus]|nr:hypothetical protein NMY22_g6863 [Coprinellus aureogranulatus]